jgi:hypothetical protein
MKKILIGVGVVVIGVIAGVFFRGSVGPGSVQSYKNTSYVIDNQIVTLRDGVSEVAALPGSASKVTTRYFGTEARGDLNGDGTEDVAFVLTQEGGGSGTFYYAVAALQTPAGYLGTNAVLLGDRIALQTSEIRDGVIVINYAKRNPNEPMTSQPSVGVSERLVVSGANTLTERL